MTFDKKSFEEELNNLKNVAVLATTKYNEQQTLFNLLDFMFNLKYKTINCLLHEKYDSDVTDKPVFRYPYDVIRQNKLPKQIFHEYLYDDFFRENEQEYLAWAKETKKQLNKLWKDYQKAKKEIERLNLDN